MKTFKENFQPEKIKIADIKGNEYEIETIFIPSKTIKAIEDVSLDKKMTEMNKVYKMLNMLTGQPEEFFKPFSMDLLLEVVIYLRGTQKKN